jgi:hypothetical protein
MKNTERKKTIWFIVVFSVLVNGVAWLGPIVGGSPSSPELGFVLWGMTPLFVSLLMGAITKDWSDFGIRPALGENIHWYIVSFLAIPVLMVLTVVAAALVAAGWASWHLP